MSDILQRIVQNRQAELDESLNGETKDESLNGETIDKSLNGLTIHL